MTLQAKLSGELLADVESWDGTVMVLHSPRAFAPGAPLALSLLPPEPAVAVSLDAKALGSKKREDGRFEVRVRLVNLRREARVQLDALFGR